MKSTIYNLTFKESSKKYGEDLQKLMDQGYKIYDLSYKYTTFVKVDVYEGETIYGKSAWIRSLPYPRPSKI
jgi:hypothetical protein